MSSSSHFVLLPLLFLIFLLSFECVLLAPNLFSPQKGTPFDVNGDAIDSSFAEGTPTERLLAVVNGEERAMTKRSSRMVNALTTFLSKRKESGPNELFRVRVRSLDQMGNTNCYFSPVQCYFFEER